MDTLEPNRTSPGQWGARLGTTITLLLILLLGFRSGMARRYGSGIAQALQHRPRTILRVWDWWAPSTNEKYARYFEAVEREYEATHPDVDLQLQFVPFVQYEQKMATALVGASPPDVFQSSVYWAEGFYDRGMLLPLNGFLDRDRVERSRLEESGRPVPSEAVVDRDAFLESAWRHNSKPDGAVFGIPQILDSNALTWNLDILERAAATDEEVRAMFLSKSDGTPDYGRLRWNAVRDWAQFRRIVRRLSKFDQSGRLETDASGQEVQAGFAVHAHGSGAAPFLPWLAANGTNFEDDEGTRALFDSDAGEETTRFILDLYWKDRVSPAFRRQMSDEEGFNTGRVACVSAGTWSGKYIKQNTEGRVRFDQTAYPPGPRGRETTTLSWGNVLVIPRSTRKAELAWDYVKFITSLPGALRLLKHVDQNSPRKDFYETPAWDSVCRENPHLWNIPAICASGKKLRCTQINAIDHAVQPVFESLLLRAPEITAGTGPYPSIRAGLQAAAASANRVYDRYNHQAETWSAAWKSAQVTP